MTAAPLVEVENVGRIFDVSKPWLNRLTEGLPRQLLPAVADVSFTIARRETFALVGESGSGKSTVAKMIVGLVAPTTGSVVIDGVSMTDPKQEAGRRQLRRRIQMVFQDPYASLNPRWRARDIVAEPLRRLRRDIRAGGHRRQGRRAACGWSASIRPTAPSTRTNFPAASASGSRSRARSRARPDFIVCDEPTSALDVSVQAQILNLMRDLQDRFGLTYLFISHNLAVVRHMANRIGVMYLGRLVEVAAAKDLFRAPRHPYTRMLLDAVPDLDPSGRARKPIEGEVPNPIDPPPGCAFHPRCRYATARCRAEQPQLMAAGTAMVACHAVAEGRT